MMYTSKDENWEDILVLELDDCRAIMNEDKSKVIELLKLCTQILEDHQEIEGDML